MWSWPWDAPFGKINYLSINGKNVRISGNPRIEELKIKVRNLDLDAFSWNIGKIGPTKFTALIAENDINKYLAGKLDPITDHKLKLLPGKIEFEGLYRAPLKIFIPVSLEGELLIEKKQMLILRLFNLKILNTTIPPAILKVFHPIINPIVDLRKSKIKLFIDRYEMRNGAIYVEGEAFLRTGR